MFVHDTAVFCLLFCGFRANMSLTGRASRKTGNGGTVMRAYGEMEQHGKYTLEDFGGWSRNHTKAASIRRWKRPLKKRARQVCRAALRRLV